MVKELAWITAPIVNNTDANQMAGRRPYMSAMTPATTAPTEALAAHRAVMSSFSESLMGLLSRSDPITTNTPEITPVYCNVN